MTEWYTGPKTHPSVPRRVVRVSSSHIRQLREDFSYSQREIFRSHHPAPSSFQIHHIVPLLLGGGNAWHNLVMVHPKRHQSLHDMIDAQIEGMLVGESRLVDIPVYSGKVWGKKKLMMAAARGIEPRLGL